jgi:ABC-type sugar transport system substrate-binding protein
MMRALENVRLDGRFPWSGSTGRPGSTACSYHGKIEALVIQDPNSMGYLSVKLLAAAVHGAAIPPRTLTQVQLVTRDMVSQPEVRKLLYPSEILER